MSLFGNLTTDGLEEAQDRLGGFSVRESDAYTGTIKAMYAGKSTSSNAQSITLIMDMEAGGEYRETYWITNGKDENFYLDKQDQNKKHPLPGFTIIDDICMMTTNKPLSAQQTADKIVNVYDPNVKQEVPTSVPMLIEVLGKKVTLGLIKEIKNKQKKDANGNYVDTEETREENVTDKVFHHPSNLTLVEAKRQVQTPAFYQQWIEKNRGKDKDRRSKGNGNAGAPGKPPVAGQAAAKTASLFGPN